MSVTLQRFLRFGPFVTRGVSLDISVRGMSALICGAPRVGETVVIALPLPELLRSKCWRPSATAAMPSLDLSSIPLSSIAQKGIQDWIRELQEHEEKLFPYPYALAPKVGQRLKIIL